MKINYCKTLLIILFILVFIVGCTADNTDPIYLKNLTIEELSQYNGKDGNPAYIAVDGTIYDVTEVTYWKDGEHNGFTAGKDLTEEIKTISPHGVSKLKGLPVVGELIE